MINNKRKAVYKLQESPDPSTGIKITKIQTEIKQIVQSNGVEKKKFPNSSELKNIVEEWIKKPEYKEYKRLDFVGNMYKLNDYVTILNADDIAQQFVAKLIKIIKIQKNPVLNIAQVQWYYRKSDINQRSMKQQEIALISDYEVFPTNHYDYIYIESLNGKCEILSYEDYDSNPSVFNNVYFQRAQYDYLRKKIFPPISEWPKGCICNKPLNPDLEYIQCESCLQWIHHSCSGLEPNQCETNNLDKLQNYQCFKCLQK